MGNTTNHNIYYLSNGDPQSQITESATQAGTIETALDSVSSNIESVNNFGVQHFANASARDLALTNPEVGWLSQLDSELFMRRWNGAAWRPYGMSEFPIVPSAVGGSTGLSVDEDGWINFTNADAAWYADGVLTSEFSRYKLVIAPYQLSADSALQFRYRRSGVSDSSTNYLSGKLTGSGSSVTFSTGSASSFGDLVGDSHRYGELEITIDRMQTLMRLTATFTGWKGDGTTVVTRTSGRNTTSPVDADGIEFFLGAGGSTTWTGRMKFYGIL